MKPAFITTGSVSDPHTLNADPDPGFWLNTDPGSGSLPNQAKKIFLIASFLAFHSINTWLLNPMLFRKTYLK